MIFFRCYYVDSFLIVGKIKQFKSTCLGILSSVTYQFGLFLDAQNFYSILSLTNLLIWCFQMFNESQRILERQRFQFPANWLYSDNIKGEWGAFSDIMKRKDSSIQTQVASLQMKIVSEDKIVESKTHDMLSEWEKEKPVEVRR